jgi:hypothetical protein
MVHKKRGTRLRTRTLDARRVALSPSAKLERQKLDASAADATEAVESDGREVLLDELGDECVLRIVVVHDYLLRFLN